MPLNIHGKAAATFIATNLLTGSVANAANQPKPTVHYVPEFSNMLAYSTNTTASFITDLSFLSPVERKIQKATIPGYVTPTVLERIIRETAEQRPITLANGV